MNPSLLAGVFFVSFLNIIGAKSVQLYKMNAILLWVYVSLSFPFVLFAETRIPVNSNEITLSFAPVVKRAAPAVVNIYAKRLVNQNRSPFQNDPFLGDSFK